MIGINRVCTDVFYQLACPPMCPQDYVNPWKAGIAHNSSPVEIHPTKSPKNPPTTYALDIMEWSGTSLELRLTYSVGLNCILGVLSHSDPRSPARRESGSKPGARCDAREASLKQDATSRKQAWTVHLTGFKCLPQAGAVGIFMLFYVVCLQGVYNVCLQGVYNVFT